MKILASDCALSDYHKTLRKRNGRKIFSRVNGTLSSGSEQTTTFKASNGLLFKMVVKSPHNSTPGNELFDFYKAVKGAIVELRSYVREAMKAKNEKNRRNSMRKEGAGRFSGVPEEINKFQDDKEIIEGDTMMFPQLPQEGQRKINYEIFLKLCMKFPKIDENYIRRFCPQDWIPNISNELQFTQIVQILIEHYAMSVVDKLWIKQNGSEKKEDPTFEEIHRTLLDYFSDAEPGYIRSVTESHYRNKEKLYHFIKTSMETPTYPKKKIQHEPIKFDVQQFMKIFPDPKKYFEDPLKKYNYDQVAYKFLLSMFRKHHPSTIQKIYCENYCNMSITARILSKTRKDVGKDYEREEPTTKKVSLLHEISYIRHRLDIEKYLEGMERMKKKEIKKVKATNNFLVCQRCFDTKCIPSRVSKCHDGHVFCNSCFVKGMNARLEKNEINVGCFVACESKFRLETLESLLDSWKFRNFIKAKQMDEITAAKIEGVVSCPFCQFAAIPPADDEIFKCLDPFCMIESCIRCKKPDHTPFLCQEVTNAREE